MTDKKSHSFQMRADRGWLDQIDDWRRRQADLPPRAEAIRRLVGMGLRFGLTEGDKVSSPVGLAIVKAIRPAIGHVEVETKNGEWHTFRLSEIRVLI